MLSLSPIEEAIQQALQRAEDDETSVLLWLRRRFPPEVAAQAVKQIALRQRAERKFSRAHQMWFTPEGLEQSSSETAATYHASRFPRDVLVVDAGCGIGGDLVALAARGETAGVERDARTLLFAQRNAQVYEVSEHCALIHADLLRLPLEKAPFLFLDPSRRTGGRRTSAPSEWQPNWATVCQLAGTVHGALVKSTPALRPQDIPTGCEREYLSIEGECRELLLAFGECQQGVALSALVLPVGARLCSTHAQPPPISPPREWIYDPDPAVVAAQLLPELAEQLDGYLLHPRIAYLTASQQVDTPFARAYRLLEHFPYSRKRLLERLRAWQAGKITVKKRGVNLLPEQLVHAWKPQGDREITVLLYRDESGVVALLAEPAR
ncbi:MAG: class I SAM-dependent methyltransferase [Armatimonadota bacterium]|nr:class I SAM-dependent methyltransferase [Armatimonadota bacterium]